MRAPKERTVRGTASNKYREEVNNLWKPGSLNRLQLQRVNGGSGIPREGKGFHPYCVKRKERGLTMT